MKINMKFIYAALLIVAIFTVNGCASSRKGQKTTEFLNSITHINQAISVFGPPSNAVELQDGSAIYVWSAHGAVDVPSFKSTTQTHYGTFGEYKGTTQGGTWVTERKERFCEVRILVAPNGQIVSKGIQGNACP